MMRKILLAVLGLVTFNLVSAGLAEPAASRPMLADAQAGLSVGKDDRILGKPDAPITIIEYASLTCPHCAHFANDVLPELKKKWIDTGKVKLVLRDFPLRTAGSVLCVYRHVLCGAGQMGHGARLSREPRAPRQARRHEPSRVRQ